MDNHKIMIVGTGNVGASIAFALLNQRTVVNEIVLTDIIAKDAEGEAMDLRDALAVAPSYLKIKHGTYKDAKDCDMVVIAAGAPQKPNQTRTALLKKNANILKGMVEQIMSSGFDGIFLVVTNPVDTLTALVQKVSGLPAEKVIGTGTVLDSARLRQRIAEYVDINPKSVDAYQIGEHGDTSFALWSLADLGGQPISSILPKDTLSNVSDFVVNEVYEIIDRKGATYYGIAACVVMIINCIMNDERRILSVSTYDNFTDTYYGYPSVIGREGVLRRLDLKLSEEEGINLQKSVNALKKSLKELHI